MLQVRILSGPHLSVALAAAIAFTGLAAALTLRSWPASPACSATGAITVPPAASTPSAPARHALNAPVRRISATLYPDEAIRRPPFGIRSASSGPYGFVVTDDGHALIPGSRWHAFTLVRVESGRAVFAGPHAAELTW